MREDIIYSRIPPEVRSQYGAAMEDVVECYVASHPEAALDLSDVDSILDFIVNLLCMKVEPRTFALKGGYVMRKLVPEALHTSDVDMSDATEEARSIIRESLREIAHALTDRGALLAEVTERGLTVRMADGMNLGVDISIHSLDYGITMQDTRYQRFTVERMLCDKISATLSPRRFRRTKYLFDIRVMLNNFRIDRAALFFALQQRGVLLTPENTIFSAEVLRQWSHAWDKLELYRYSSSEMRASKPDYQEVMDAYACFLADLMTGKECRWDLRRISC